MQKRMAGKILNHWKLGTYQLAFEAAMNIHNLSMDFPREEQYALTDQIRRSSHSVCSEGNSYEVCTPIVTPNIGRI